jgi:Secretion system C-terminal sorting domain
MKAKILIFICLSIFTRIGQAQNLISNHSFESGSSNKPNNVAQLVDCSNWDANQYSSSGDIIHSPDWFDSRPGFLSIWNLRLNGAGQPLRMTPRTGNRFAGLLCGETLEQNLSAPLESCQKYRLSFFIKQPERFKLILANNSPAPNVFGSGVGVRLKIFLSPDKIKYKDGSATFECSEEWRTKTSSNMRVIEVPTPNREIGFDDAWAEITTDFIAPSSFQVSWIGIENADASSGMIFFDDVTLEKIPLSACNNCSPEDGSINPLFANNPMTIGSGSGVNASSKPFTIKNISNVKFVNIKGNLTNAIGQSIGSIRQTISNPGCEIKWDGRDDAGNFVPAGFYNLNIEFINNCVCTTRVGSVSVVYATNGDFIQINNESFPNKIDPLATCCRNTIVIEPQTFDVSTCLTLDKNFQNSFPQRHLKGPSTYKARNNIVIKDVSLEGSMTFRATNFIDIQGSNISLNGGGMTFTSKEVRVLNGILRPGTDIKIETTPTDCPVQLLADEPEIASQALSAFKPEFSLNANTNTIQVSPNPTTGLISIDLNSFKEGFDSQFDIYIYDMKGATIYQQNNFVNSGYLDLDLSKQMTGIYILKIKSPNGLYTYKIVKE